MKRTHEVWSKWGLPAMAGYDASERHAVLRGVQCHQLAGGVNGIDLAITHLIRGHQCCATIKVRIAAGWHRRGGRLKVPESISLLSPPPYSPELNPVENVWQYLKQNFLSNRVFYTYDHIVDACCSAWNALMAAPDRIRTIAQREWAKTVRS